MSFKIKLRLHRAWYKLLYSDGDERTSMWGFIMDVVKKKRRAQADLEKEGRVRKKIWRKVEDEDFHLFRTEQRGSR